jgi:hypothetical protein
MMLSTGVIAAEAGIQLTVQRGHRRNEAPAISASLSREFSGSVSEGVGWVER